MKPVGETCPCCGYLTLGSRAGFEICAVCFWEDDGQDDVDAHLALGGPNGGTLWQARTNYLQFGACEQAMKELVRGPGEDEPRLRSWRLVDDVALELVPAADVSPWNLLHDGAIDRMARHGLRVTTAVRIPYLRTRFSEPGDGFVLELFDCTEVVYSQSGGDASNAMEEISAARPEILSAEHEDGVVIIYAEVGVLRLRYQELALRFDSGAPLALAALDDCALRYWDGLSRR